MLSLTSSFSELWWQHCHYLYFTGHSFWIWRGMSFSHIQQEGLNTPHDFRTPWSINANHRKYIQYFSMNVTWLSILISVRVSLSRSASTKAWIPEPVMKLDSKFKLCNVLFARNMSLKAWNRKWEDRILKTFIYNLFEFKSQSVSPQPLDHYSVLLPCWTFWHACSSPLLLQCPSA